jgi:hypothetical protein
MTRECHVRFCEGLVVKLRWSTYLQGRADAYFELATRNIGHLRITYGVQTRVSLSEAPRGCRRWRCLGCAQLIVWTQG